MHLKKNLDTFLGPLLGFFRPPVPMIPLCLILCHDITQTKSFEYKKNGFMFFFNFYSDKCFTKKSLSSVLNAILSIFFALLELVNNKLFAVMI